MKKFLGLCILPLLFVMISLISCSKGGSYGGTSVIPPLVTTVAATSISGQSVTLGGNITSNGGGTIYDRGVCWSTSIDPTINTTNFISDHLDQIGPFSFTLTTQLLPNTFYYARAYCTNNIGITYGSSVSFTTGNVTTTLDPAEILCGSAKLKGSVLQPAGTIATVGFVYNTTPNPTINNSSINTTILGSAPYELTISNLVSNTIYYVRSYWQDPSGLNYSYGAEKQLRTTGYFGPANGYVAYDKGDNTGGWRYMEIYPTTLNYNIAFTTGGAWGGYGTFVSGTYSTFGTGPANTAVIVAGVAGANCAAKLCDNAIINGYSDWYLPSSDEMLTLSNSLLKKGVILGDYTWTSTQRDANYALATIYKSGPPARFETFDSYPKSFDNLNIYPVRRY
jgi:hypothetical protein